MENHNGKGIFYGVIGVATLVVAIIGATFAYFSATDTDDSTIQGEAATAGLTLTVEKVSTGATNGLIPMGDGTVDASKYPNVLDKALKATTMCVDANNNTVCQVYKLTVKNDGTSTAIFDGTLELTATGYANLKWANMNLDAGLTTDAVPTTVGSTLNVSSVKAITTNETYTAGQTKYYYIMVYINETGESQNNTDKGSFTGVVNFQSAGGTGTTATFTA